MSRRSASLAFVVVAFCALAAVLFSSASSLAVGVVGQSSTAEPTSDYATYQALRAFALDGGATRVSGLTLRRDRAEMTFTGTFYFSKPIHSVTTGAVFVGQGRFHAEPPAS